MGDRKNSFLLEHSGMLQSDRPGLAPSPAGMKVSGRTFEDLVKRSAEFARSVIFYGDDLDPDGDWSAFFKEIYDYEYRKVRTEVLENMIRTSSVRPHLALMFAFFRMLLVAQEDINRLTERQMEFYFRDVLGFGIRKGEEGTVTVFAELAKNADSVSIPKGLLFDAGKDSSGQNVVYESIDELRIGKENVAYIAKYSDSTGFIGIGEENPDCRHSIYIASKLFSVRAEEINVSIGEDEADSSLLEGLVVEYTSENGWTPVVGGYGTDGIFIGNGMPLPVPFNPSIHGEGMKTEFPVFRFVSEKGMGVLSGISPMQLGRVRVTVRGCEPLHLENKYGQVENISGINPFGYERLRKDWFEVVFPFPASSSSVSVMMNDDTVYDKTDESPDKVRYEINSDRCDQTEVSKNFTTRMLHAVRKDTYDEGEIDSAMSSQMMAVLPRLLSPVIISAEFEDRSPDIYLSHPCGGSTITDRMQANAPLWIGSEKSALYLALENAEFDRGQISLHIRTSGKVTDPGNVTWTYLSDDGTWKTFSESRIIRDTTEGLSQDGNVIFDCRDKLPRGGFGLMVEGYTWIRGECDNSNCMEIRDVRSRAIELVYSRSSRGAGPGGASLPKESITKTIGSIVGLKKITQPFDGNTGSVVEDSRKYRRRVAETLRHKNRAWSVWDYESLILEKFNEVAYAKCLPSCDENGETSPGTVTVMVIPKTGADSLKPTLGVRTINGIRSTLYKLTSSFVRIKVLNPTYREISVTAQITLRKGYNDSAIYETEVSDALIEYLRSWKGDENGVHFRESSGVSDIIAFLESLPCVDVVETIEVSIDGTDVSMDGKIEIDTPLNVITSAPTHTIHCKTAY